VERIRGRSSVAIGAAELAAGAAGRAGVLLDIGTGDGRYVLHVARTRPDWFAVGVDACKDNLRRASRKAPDNALYVVANALSLPGELAGMASLVTVNFPWGSLLTGLLEGEQALIHGLLTLLRPGAALEIRANAGALARFGCTPESGGDRMRRVLRDAGLDAAEPVRLSARELRQYPTTWARRLAYGRDPRAVYLRAVSDRTRNGPRGQTRPAATADHSRLPLDKSKIFDTFSYTSKEIDVYRAERRRTG
jgi:16S rRNA (adenine(1408)-N(1))-methyltransferase